MAAKQPAWSLKMTAPLEMVYSVNDIDTMIDFYTEILGLKVVSDANVPAEITEKNGQTPHGLRVVRLATPYGEWIRLVQAGRPPEPDKVPKYIFERHGIVYCSFVVSDIDSIVDRLKENEVKLYNQGEKVEVRPGLFIVYALDPEGNIIEFLEIEDIDTYRPDLYKYRQFF